jgi:hypothetical protein
MARTFIRQGIQIKNSDVYDDQQEPDVLWESASSLEDDLNNLRSQIQNMLNRDGDTMPSDNWYDNIVVPGTFENGRQRGIDALNSDLHGLERKRVLTSYVSVADIIIPNNQNWVILSASTQVPNPTGIGKVVALGTTEFTGSVAVQHAGTFDTHSLSEVGGATAISPKNLLMIVTGSNRDPLLHENSIIYGLLQTENGTNGHALNDIDKRAQISFVMVDPVAGNDLIAAPVESVENKVINYVSVVRKALGDLNEQDFLRGAEIDVPSTSATTRQNAYDNQGTTAVEVTNNATLDINSGFYWEIRDNSNATVFKIEEGSTDSDTTISVSSDVDYLDINAVDVDFSQGAKFDTGGTRIDIGVTAGVIETTATDDLKLLGARELLLSDGNMGGSTWSATSIKLTDATGEWDKFESAFGGEVSLIQGIYQAKRRAKVYTEVTADAAANANVSLASTNLSVELPYMDAGSFGTDYDVYLNGQLLFPGANSGSNNDYYPGTDANSLKFEFPLKTGDVICVVPYVRA